MEQINNQTLYQAILKVRGNFPKRKALYYKNKYINYLTLIKNINLMSSFLKTLGIIKDDVVSIALPNTFVTVYLIYAVNQIGAINNLIHPLIKSNNLKKIINKVNSKILFCLDTSYSEYFKELDEDILIVPVNPTFGLNKFVQLAYHLLNKKNLQFKNKIKINLNKYQEYKEFDKDYLKDSFYLQSGGTSGDSKTIALSNFAINALVNEFPKMIGFNDAKDMYMLATLPTFHGFGLAVGIHTLLSYGGCDMLLPKFSTKETIKLINKDKLTFIIGIPRLYQALLNNKKFDTPHLKSLKYTFVGGDSVSKALKSNFDNLMIKNNSIARLYEGYGLTEVVTVCSLNINNFYKEGSVGKLLNNVKCKIIDENLNDVTYLKEGEIYLSGETLMNGYRFNNEESFIYDENNVKWVKTGDYGFLDKDNFLYFKQRIKQIIKIKGINLYPKEIESVVKELDFIFDCSVLGIKEENLIEEKIYLFVVINKLYENKNYEFEIKATISKDIGEIALPFKIIYLDKIDKTDIGKTDYKKLISRINN